MSLIKKYNNKEEVIAEKQIIDHNQLSNRDAYGAHSIQSIRKLPEKLHSLKTNEDRIESESKDRDNALKEEIDNLIEGDLAQLVEDVENNKNKISEVESNSQKIDVEDNDNGTFTFTNYNSETKTIRSGYSPDETTIEVKDNKLTAIGLDFPESTTESIFNSPIKAKDIDGRFKQDESTISSLDTRLTKNEEKDSIQDNKIYDLQSRFKGIGGYLDANNFGKATPTQDELTNYTLQQIGITDKLDIFNQTKVKNEFDGNIWVLTNTPDSEPAVFDWANNGNEYINTANNQGLQGVVTGSYNQWEGFVDVLGHISINGLEEFTEETKKKTDIIKTNGPENSYLSGDGTYKEIDLSGYVDKSSNQTIGGHKDFTGSITKNGEELATETLINSKITQTISSTSTSEEIPSAKAVYDYINSAITTVLNTEV